MRFNCTYILKIIFLLCAIHILPTPAAQAEKAPFIIAHSELWPLLRTEENGTKSGIFYEIIYESMKRLNIKIKWEYYPWARCQNHVESGIADAILTVPTDERATYTETHPTPFYHSYTQLFTYKGHPKKDVMDKIKTPQDIKDTGLTVITYLGNGWNKDNIQPLGITTYEASEPENIWPMLARQRGDIIIEWPLAAWPEITNQNVSEKIILTNGTIASFPFHLLISKKSKYLKILPEFDQVIQNMLKDGTIKRIIKGYTQQVHKE
ncbi:ABC transporter substrate-binding protein [Desulfovibrio sp. JC010]|uniref:substrate-binding periplasmic protein n=1 Tax=Desulfovibrio sp. JC010 TaxID=2593641 RepID=UPI0013D2AA12|nr:transporter substrate-binding domain-containing protein [Desulfovibrio sp. JC010]NDV28599.1 transporter substrate-binding domain-containing protein [Desulfovibrio sp. JC010]